MITRNEIQDQYYNQSNHDNQKMFEQKQYQQKIYNQNQYDQLNSTRRFSHAVPNFYQEFIQTSAHSLLDVDFLVCQLLINYFLRWFEYYFNFFSIIMSMFIFIFVFISILIFIFVFIFIFIFIFVFLPSALCLFVFQIY